VNALATVQVGTATALFTSSQGGNDGLTLSDADGNSIKLTAAGNVTASVQNATIGQVTVGNSQFQIGANSGQTTSLSLGNFAASQLGGGVVSGLNLSNLDITTASGASDALKVIDAAIDGVAKSRGQIGSFQRNILESNIRSLGVAKENLAATESTIRDTDVATEMTNFTKLQILQQAGMSMLGQANAAPQSVLSLLRG
jgi:flagellin